MHVPTSDAREATHKSRNEMKRRSIAVATGVASAAAVILLVSYYRWTKPAPAPVLDLLSNLPPGASSVLYVNLADLRRSPFLTALYRWAPQPQADADYTQFVQATGFNYERDLDYVGVGAYKNGSDTTLFAIADGRFDRKKISAYALQTGKRASRDGREFFSIPASTGPRQVSFTFPRSGRVALTNRADLDFSGFQQADSDAQGWRERFLRLAGSPIFAVFRQGSAPVNVLSGAGGLRSPDLSALLNQLQWITVAGKPEADNLRVVLEGEGSPQTNTLQISDLINGLLVFAQAGLNDPKLRAQLQPQVRDAYLQLLRSVDVSRLDRGDTKSVRLILEVTPDFLEAIRPSAPGESPSLLPKLHPEKGSIRN